MDRREFLKQSIGFGAGIAATTLLGKYGNLFADDAAKASAYDLVAVKNGEADAMFDKAIAAMGGMQAFVKKGQTVVVKPNIGWSVAPEMAANTNPNLVKRIIQRCYEAGAKKVYVFDHTCDTWTACYKASGIEEAAKAAGAVVVPGNTEANYQLVQIPGGVSLKSAKVHELILSSDVFINVPVLKHHSSGNLTIGMKNLMGIVWDRWYWHGNNLHQCIADFAAYRKPDLTVVDAYAVMKANGPRGTSKADVQVLKNLLIAKDIVIADSAAAMVWGRDPTKVPYIKIASDKKLGTLIGSVPSDRIMRITL